MTSHTSTSRRSVAGPAPVTPPRRTATSAYDLAERQLAALDAWHRRRRQQQEAASAGQRSREQRLDLARRMDVLREQHRAIIARTDAQLRASAELLRPQHPRVLVAHRNEWFVGKLQQALEASGVEVIGHPSNGAEAVGVAIAEQPDLVLVEDTLPMLSGEEVVRDVLAYCPEAIVTAQVAYEDGVARMLDAGARAAYARRVPPAEVAVAMLSLLERVPA